MSFSVGEIGLDLVLNSKGFLKQVGAIRTQANSASSKISSSFKKIGAAVAAAFSVKAITAFGKSCIDLGSNLTEVQNVVDVTFKSMSGSVNKWAKDATASYGLSETMAKKYVGTFGSMAEAFGFTEKQSYDMSTALTGLTGDVASFYNLSQDEAYTKLKSVFTGETESLKDLGVVMTQSALDSYALANGYGKTTEKMTEAEKVSLRFAFVQKQLTNATGDFARTQNSWANQTRVLQLQFDSLKATLGQGLINTFTPVIEVINSLISRLSTVSEKFKELTSQLFGNAGGTSSTTSNISSAADSASALTDEAQNSSSALQNVADSAEKAKRSVAGFDKLNILSKNDTTSTTTSGATPTTSSTKPTSTTAMSGAVDKFASSWNSKGQKVVNSIKKAFDNIKGAVKAIGTSWSAVWNNGSGKKLVDNIKTSLSNCFDIIGDIAGAFTKAWKKGDLGNQVVQSIIDKWNSLVELVNTIAGDFKKVWNDGTGERIWNNILNIIKNCNNYVATFRDKIKQAWNKNETGKKLWQDILGIVEDVTDFIKDLSEIRLDWMKTLDLSPLLTGVEKLAGAFRELLKACGDKLKTAYKNILLPLAKWTIEKAVPKLVEMLAGALKGIADIVKKIQPSVLQAIAGGITSIGTAIIAFKAGSAIAGGINKVKTAMNLLMTTLEAHPILALLTGVAAAITGLVTAIELSNDTKWKDLGFEDVSNDMQSAVDKINNCKNNINEMCENIDTSLTETSTEMGVIDSYKQRLDELLQKADLTPSEQSELATIGDYFSKKYPDFEKAWNDYIKKDDNGTISITGNIDEITTNLDGLIDQYKKVAANAALSNLAQENQTSLVASSKEVTNAATAYKQAQQDIENFKNEWDLTDAHLKTLQNSPDFYTWQNKNSTRNSSAGDLKKEYDDLTSKLNEAESSYDDVSESAAQLELNSSDLSKMQAVVNGDYSNASAVLMAYNAGLISTEDVQNSQWKSLSKLQETAKSSGENIVFGLANGIDSYKDEIKKRGLDNASLYLNNLTGKDGLDENSPSKKTYQAGVYAVQGLVNGISDTSDKVKSPLQTMIDKIKEKLNPIKDAFKNVFGGIWGVIVGPINTVMSGIENFINGILSGVRNIPVVKNILSAVGWDFNSIDRVTLPRFAKGAIVKAPTLAVVGDNAGANTGNPEVIAPLNKLQSMMNTSNGYDTEILNKMLTTLNRIYEMFVMFRNTGGNMYEFVAKLNGSALFDEMVSQNELYKKRHNGKSAF